MTDQTSEHPSEHRPESCSFALSIGVYLMGGLSEEDSTALLAHLDQYPECAAELDALRPIVTLMDRRVIADRVLASTQEPSNDLGPKVLAAAVQERAPADAAVRGRTPSRTRLVAASALALTFAAGTGFGTQFGPTRLVAAPPAKESPGDAPAIEFPREEFGFASVKVPQTGVRAPSAWTTIEQRPTGTYAWLSVTDFEVGKVYKWWFEQRDGTRVPLGSFRFEALDHYGRPVKVRCPGHTSLYRDQLAAIGATDESGVEVFRRELTPPGKPKKT